MLPSTIKVDTDWKQIHRCAGHLLYCLYLLKLVNKRTSIEASMDVRSLTKYIETTY